MLIQSSQTNKWFERVPKVELHLHLEGAIPYPALWELIQKYGGDPTLPDIAALNDRFVYRDFAHFLDTWTWKNQFLREYADFAFIAEAVATDLARQNVRYAEVFYSPPDFVKYGLNTQEITHAVRTGLSRVPDIEIALIADLVRNFGPERAAVTLAEVNEVKDRGVIGIGMGGSELILPGECFTAVYEQARQFGLHTCVHTGEIGSAQNMWKNIRALRVERVGHAASAINDESLMDYLAETQLPIEACPLSNVRTGGVKSIEDHPVRRYFERGLMVTVNTDDPKMFGNSLADEYRTLVDNLGFSLDDIRAVILNGLRSAWISDDRKRQMIDAFRNEPGWLIPL